MPVLAIVSCAHCHGPVPLEFMPEPNTGYVCDPCELDYYKDMARTLGGVAFRCVRCNTAVLGWELGSQLCDDCEDALHAEALALRPPASGSTPRRDEPAPPPPDLQVGVGCESDPAALRPPESKEDTTP